MNADGIVLSGGALEPGRLGRAARGRRRVDRPDGRPGPRDLRRPPVPRPPLRRPASTGATGVRLRGTDGRSTRPSAVRGARAEAQGLGQPQRPGRRASGRLDRPRPLLFLPRGGDGAPHETDLGGPVPPRGGAHRGRPRDVPAFRRPLPGASPSPSHRNMYPPPLGRPGEPWLVSGKRRESGSRIWSPERRRSAAAWTRCFPDGRRIALRTGSTGFAPSSRRSARPRTTSHGSRSSRSGGSPWPGRTAGLLHFALEPSVPVVVAFAVAGGEVSYAPLSRADREAEVAVQQSDDPSRLILGYVDWARKGFHFFATRKALWCSGKSPRPPAEFVAERLESLPYRLTDTKGQGRFDCVHLAADESRPYLEVAWPGAERTFRVCRRCAKDDRHLLSSLSDGAAVPDPEGDFPVDAYLNVRCQGGPECIHAVLPGLPRALLKRYVVGRLSDGQLLDAYLDELRPGSTERTDARSSPPGSATGATSRRSSTPCTRPRWNGTPWRRS